MISKYQLIWQLMHGQRLRYGAAVAALVLASCFLYLVPLVSSVVLDVIISDNGSGTSPFILRTVESIGGRDFARANLWIAVALIFGLTAFAGLFTYLRGRWAAEATERIIRGLRDRLYDQLQHLPCSYYDRAETGDLIQRCTSDVETVRQFLLNQVVEIGRAALMLLVPLPLMYAIDPRMTGVSLILIPPIVGFSVVFFRKVRQRFEEVDKAEVRRSQREPPGPGLSTLPAARNLLVDVRFSLHGSDRSRRLHRWSMAGKRKPQRGQLLLFSIGREHVHLAGANDGKDPDGAWQGDGRDRKNPGDSRTRTGKHSHSCEHDHRSGGSAWRNRFRSGDILTPRRNVCAPGRLISCCARKHSRVAWPFRFGKIHSRQSPAEALRPRGRQYPNRRTQHREPGSQGSSPSNLSGDAGTVFVFEKRSRKPDAWTSDGDARRDRHRIRECLCSRYDNGIRRRLRDGSRRTRHYAVRRTAAACRSGACLVERAADPGSG